MCEDHEVVLEGDPPVQRPIEITRRRALQTAGLGVTGVLMPSIFGGVRPAFASVSGLTPFSHAMHVHTSFSEQTGSIEGAIDQASHNGIDVLWLTDHDHRMEQRAYRSVVRFSSLNSEPGDGKPWQWVQKTSGPLASTSGGISASSYSPLDAADGHSLQVGALSSSTALASLGYYAESHSAGWNYQTNLYGQTWSIEVMPTSIGQDGYLELLINTSTHLATGGRPAGLYTLSYRFGGGGQPGSRVANGTQGVITVDVAPGQWNSVVLTPTDDIAALWPDMQAHDFASSAINLNAVSTGGQASGFFDYLRFGRQFTSGQVPLQTQADIMAAYASLNPSRTVYQGLEISTLDPHVNWFGPNVTLSDLSSLNKTNYSAFLMQQIAAIHASGGVASYNHPFGSSGGPALSSATQDTKVSQMAAKLLSNNALGADLIEVGYALRAGCDLAHHVGLWDALSRNGMPMTGNGVNDDHIDVNWYGNRNNWYTSVWASSIAMSDQLAALKAGQAWTASLSRFRGTLDLSVDGTCPMGSMSVSQLAQRQLRLTATGVPANGSLQVVRGVCDYTGTVPNAVPIASYPVSALTTGSVSLGVDTQTSCFVRTQVRDSKGAVIALSNPVWLLRTNPPRGIPAARAC